MAYDSRNLIDHGRGQLVCVYSSSDLRKLAWTWTQDYMAAADTSKRLAN
jgi:hypothetical protein